MENAFSLEGRAALVTGGGTGLGKAIAACMVQAGARVVISGRRGDVLRRAAAELGPQADFVVQDVTRFDQIEEVLGAVREKVGPLQILVNNAGIHLKKDAVETTEDDLAALLNTHVVGAHALTRALIPSFLEQGGGSVIFITSMAAIMGVPYVSAYAAAKSAILGLVRTLATELSPRGIRVNAIAPGWIETDMTRHALENDPERMSTILSRTPCRRLGTPEDIGWAAVYLSSPAARFITGQQLVVDGGVSIGF
jgi:NAD(P)-dependent dehydrogenase (short-subunit alcohol dehydrogenase family)